jgi:hypothetical protein
VYVSFLRDLNAYIASRNFSDQQPPDILYLPIETNTFRGHRILEELVNQAQYAHVQGAPTAWLEKFRELSEHIAQYITEQTAANPRQRTVVSVEMMLYLFKSTMPNELFRNRVYHWFRILAPNYPQLPTSYPTVLNFDAMKIAMLSFFRKVMASVVISIQHRNRSQQVPASLFTADQFHFLQLASFTFYSSTSLKSQEIKKIKKEKKRCTLKESQANFQGILIVATCHRR